MAGIAETLIGAAVGGFLNDYSQHTQIRRQINAQKELIDYQNRYNSPANQMRLYKSAGLSPALVAASGASGGQVSPSASTSSVPVDANTGSSLVSAASNFGSNLANLQLLNAQRDNLKADTEQKLANADQSRISTQIERLRLEFLPMMLNNELSLQDIELQLKNSTLGLNEVERQQVMEQTINIVKQRDIMDKNLDILVENLKTAKSEAAIANLREYFEPKNLQAQLDKVIADKDASLSLANQLSALASNLSADTDLKNVQKGIQQVVLDYAEQNEEAKLGILKQKEFAAEQSNVQQGYLNSRLRAGQSVAKFMAPVGEVTGAIGNIFAGALKLLK